MSHPGVAGAVSRRRAVGERLAQRRTSAGDAVAHGADLHVEHGGDLRDPRCRTGRRPRAVRGSPAPRRRRRRVRRRRAGPRGRWPSPHTWSGATLIESIRIRWRRRAWSRKRFVVMRCSQPLESARLERVDRLEDPHEHVLRQVLGVVGIAGQAVREAVHLRGIVSDELLARWARSRTRLLWLPWPEVLN